MCIEVRKTCECGRKNVQFHLRDNLLMAEAVARLFCPDCPGDVPFDPGSMLMDNGWIIEYDMVLARDLIARKLGREAEEVSPQFIFDNGYATWLETYPGEREDIEAERSAIVALARTDQTAYLKRIQAWNIERMERLKEAGWRKAMMA
jgi:hypothetical protein